MLRSGFAATLAPGTIISGKYRVERVLGQGGMGVVVAARHLDLNQSLAIKVLLPSATESEEAITRFVREGRSAAQLTSPHVAKVHDTGHLDSGEPYLVMELLHGSDLRAHLTEVGLVPLPKAIAWVLQAAHALAEAHKLNIIHRDIKPANLFLAETSTGEQIKVLDFGVSKQLGISDDLTSTMATVGTPRYMAPEQMRSAKLADLRGDIWSLGVVLYELTTGQHPFQGDSITALCFDVMERTPTPPSEINPALPLVFDEVVARCLEKNPDDRFQTVQELGVALCAIAPDSARFSGFFNPGLLEPIAAVAAATPVPAVERDPTGPTKVHPQARPSRPEAAAVLDATAPTKRHSPAELHPKALPPTETEPQARPQPFTVPIPRSITVPLIEAPPMSLAAQRAMAGLDVIPSWNTSAQPPSSAKKPERSLFLALGGLLTFFALGLIVVTVISHRGASAPDGASAAPHSTTTAQPSAAPSSAPSAPVVVTLDPPSLASETPVASSSAPTEVSSSPKPVVAPLPTTFGHAPMPGCYSYNEKGHKVINPWCR